MTARGPISGRLILRADAGHQRGYGHVMRSLTLGEEFVRRGWSVELLGTEFDEFLSDRASRYGIVVTQMACEVGSRADAEAIADMKADLVVIDGYEFEPEFFASLEENEVSFIVIDDNGESVTSGAVLTINQNPHANVDMYPQLDPSRLLLGMKYALIRSEVRALCKGSNSDKAVGTRVLVSIGGTDIRNMNHEVSQALARMLDVEIDVSHPDPPHGVARAASDIALSLRNASVAVIGAGSTLWESCFLGTPAVALVVADNQVGASRAAQVLGVCEVVDCREDKDPYSIAEVVRELLADHERLLEMTQQGIRLIDGNGGSRVLDAVEAVVVRP